MNMSDDCIVNHLSGSWKILYTSENYTIAFNIFDFYWNMLISQLLFMSEYLHFSSISVFECFETVNLLITNKITNIYLTRKYYF